MFMVRKNEHMFEKSNLSPLGIRLLTFLARNPSREVYLRQLASEVDASPSGCFTAIKGLLEDNLVVSRRSGRNVYWRANPENPGLRSLKVFINIKELEGALKKVRDLSSKVVLFGSCATGEDTDASDIDLLVVTEDPERARRILSGARAGGRRINPMFLSPSGLLDLKETDRALYDEIRKGIVLWSGMHD
jgi:DNA-binding Lrp family transcriptional regulator